MPDLRYDSESCVAEAPRERDIEPPSEAVASQPRVASDTGGGRPHRPPRDTGDNSKS